MKRMGILSAFVLFLLATALSASAQSSEKPATQAPPKRIAPKPLPVEVKEFFSGEWTGAGEFANGKKIEADVSFSAGLDDQWLSYRHVDRSPNKYKASGMWGFDRDSEEFVMVLNDNFGSVRLFVSEGWLNGKIVFQKERLLSDSPVQERFTFERQAPDTFKMTYESSRDAKTWKLGDYLIFKRN